MAAATLNIRLLGDLDLRLGDTSLPALGSTRAAALLAYLLLHRGAPQPRQYLAFRLWPDSTESQARTNLRHVLHDLRRALPDVERFLDVQTQTVRWRPAAGYWLDVAAFEAAVDRAADTARRTDDEAIAALREAADLYGGDLFAACYDEWISDERDRLRQRYLAALEHLVALLHAHGRHAEAIPYAERLIRADSVREATYRLLMQLHDARGDRARALQVYRDCAAALERDLGVEPSAATRHAYEALLRGDPPRGAAAELSPRSLPAQPAGVPPLVGRAAEWTRLTSLWREVEGGRARFLLVTGEAGIGKTRLVDELRAWCALRGAATAEARSYAAEAALAFGVLASWLRSAPVAERVPRLERPRQSELARLMPELLTQLPGLPLPQAAPESDQRHRLFDAAAAALLSAGTPLMLIADDIQWCDEDTLRFLYYLLRVGTRAPLLVAATGRSEDWDGHRPLQELITAMRALDRVTEVELQRLTRAETADLAGQLASRALDQTEADTLFRETEGNPLFVVEAIHAGWQRERHAPATLSPRVQAVIASRLCRLSDPARELLGAAATLGRDFSVELLAEAGDVPVDVVVRVLDELWRSRIVRERGPHAYDFSHDKIREVAYLSLSPPRRRHWHARAAQAVKRFYRHDPTSSGQIASHYDRAGVADEAISWYEAAAEASQRLYASSEAIRLLSRALELIRSLPDTPERHARELAVLTAMLRPVANVDGFASRRLDEIQRLSVDRARTLGVEPPPQVFHSLAMSSLSRDDFEAAKGYGERLRARGQADADDALLIEGEYVLGIAAFWRGELEVARRHFEAAVADYRPDRRRAHLLWYWLDPQVTCLSRLGNTLWFLGDVDGARRARDAALALADQVGHRSSRSTALVFGALLALEMNDVERLREYVETLEVAGADQEPRPTRITTAVLRSYLRALDGEAQHGIAAIRAALDDLGDVGDAPGMRAALVRLLIAAHEAARDPRGRLAAAERALAMGGAARLWESEARRARAECLAELGAPRADVEGEFRRALGVARNQGARMLEQRAAASLLRLGFSLSETPPSTATA